MSQVDRPRDEFPATLDRVRAEMETRQREQERFAATFECDDHTGEYAPCTGMAPSEEGPLVKAPWGEMTLCPLARAERCGRFLAWQRDRDEQAREDEACAWTARGRALGLPKKLLPYSFASASPTPTVQRSRRFLDEGEAERGRALIFAGPTGVGKSVATACLVRAWPHKGALFLGVPGLVGAFLSSTRREKAINDSKKASLLVLDEFGGEYYKENGLGVALLEELLAHREAEELATVLTTNCTADELRDRLSDRIIDRWKVWGSIYICAGPSLRTPEHP